MKSLDLTRKTISATLGVLLLLWMETVFANGQLSSMRIGQAADKTRVVFDLKQTQDYQDYKIVELSNPSRLVVDFTDAKNGLSFKSKHITDSRLFKIRVSDNSKRVRVVLDLHKTPSYKTFILNTKGNQRLVLDITDKPATMAKKPSSKSLSLSKPETVVKESKKQLVNAKPAVEKNVASQQASGNTAERKTLEHKTTVAKSLVKESSKVTPLVQLSKASEDKNSTANKATQSLLDQESSVFAVKHDFVVAIDAGHGGKDTGAIGHNHIYEKEATLNMAKALKEIIDRQPGMHAVLTRDKDVFIPLSQRVQIAKEKDADLFISIHADAFHDNSVRGGSVYILSERGASSTMAKLLARSENASLDEVSLKGLDDDVAFALSDLSRAATVKESRKLAKTVLGEMQKKVKMHKHSVQSAGFAVLKSIDMPSLLIETAFISNPHEARNLMSRKFQTKMASAIVDGLAKYVEQNTKKPRWGETLYVQYKVQRGDTLSQIAENYEVSTQTLKKLNGIKNANSLYVGKKLKIPVSEKLVAGL
ncbi:N-acetylmuramoyl-L-alanine amidase [Thiomicrorhabdus immobilis]|uniref:N-acetylmuramoyl-L-alanine amidase n=1 Tax=Thiomicrorhabdus immobilis TaxID=2791037 RepID=A0ABM7ME16_9GAMM|nr:N-acetylmuramoyl-L-alanine amidase [Thiomicrorhabdus immobilis]BCN93642.1 N-acetylmuramoyl-L-alanine amidase [Thiomicrorhabdus immobilis]